MAQAYMKTDEVYLHKGISLITYCTAEYILLNQMSWNSKSVVSSSRVMSNIYSRRVFKTLNSQILILAIIYQIFIIIIRRSFIYDKHMISVVSFELYTENIIWDRFIYCNSDELCSCLATLFHITMQTISVFLLSSQTIPVSTEIAVTCDCSINCLHTATPKLMEFVWNQ